MSGSSAEDAKRRKAASLGPGGFHAEPTIVDAQLPEGLAKALDEVVSAVLDGQPTAQSAPIPEPSTKLNAAGLPELPTLLVKRHRPEEALSTEPTGGRAPAVVVVVDADPVARFAMRDVLRARGHTARLVRTLQEALQAISNPDVDLLIIGAGLGPGALDLARQLRGDERPAVVIMQDPSEPLDVGGVVTVPRPLSALALVRRVESAIPLTLLEPVAEATPASQRSKGQLPRNLALLEARLKPLRDGGERPDLESAHAIACRLKALAKDSRDQLFLDAATGLVALLKKHLVDVRLPEEAAWTVIDRHLATARMLLADAAILPQSSNTSTVMSANILLLEPEKDTRRQLSAAGRAHLVDVTAVQGTEAAMELARAVNFDAAIINLDVDGDALQVARALRSMDDMPVACVVSDGAVSKHVDAVHAGASLFLRAPLSNEMFVNAVRHLLALRARSQPRVLVVDDDPSRSEDLREMLEGERMQITWLTDPRKVLQVLPEVRADLLLLDVEMSGLTGFEVCRLLRATPSWQGLPILLMTRRVSPELRLAAFRAGADDYLTRPIDRDEFMARIKVRMERARLARERADRDALTGLLARRAFNDSMLGWLAEARRNGRPVSICLIDLDHFKGVNDTYGHLAGDRVLVGLGRLLSQSFRTEDLRGRWGGEEFVVAFNNEGLASAREILNRARAEFSELAFEGDHGEVFQVTFSAGISTYPDDGETVEALMRVADRRLYLAKKAGRNMVMAEPHT